MKLKELIEYLIKPELLVQLYQELGVNSESEALLIYLKDSLDIESEISIFEIEETEDDLFFEKLGKRFIQLFAVNQAIDLIAFDLDLKNKGYSDLDIALRLLEYRLNDA